MAKQQSTPVKSDPPAAPPAPETPASAPPLSKPPPAAGWKPWLKRGAIGVVIVLLLVYGVPFFHDMWTTVETDDAYVNGHVTFVAPRVAGQVARVFVDDNNRVRKGDVLVQLDREPFEVAVRISQSAVDAAEADLVAARAQTRGLEGHARSLRFGLQRAIEDVHNQIALLRSKVATLGAQKATQANAQNEYDRVLKLFKNGSAAKQEMDDRIEALLVSRAKVDEAMEQVYQVRVSLGLSREPETGQALSDVPADLPQTFSAVRQAQAALLAAAAQLGVSDSMDKSPEQMLTDFYKRDPQGNIDRIYEKLLNEAPAVKQSESRLAEARRNLELAKLNLSYCDVVSEIDGVVTRREVNPGNNVVVGQAVMAVRSLTEIWIDANFKETQLSRLRIGLPVELEVDMYGSKNEFKGRISGFTMGTGSTLALLPAENATGNFVKVVQRLPVRIEVLDYDPDRLPLFIGLSVTPKVLLNEQPSGPNAGALLQPFMAAAPASTTTNTARSIGAAP